MIHLVRHLRAARLAFAALLAFGALVAVAALHGGARAAEREATIGADPWTEAGFSPVFAANDAYVFDDSVRAHRLDAEAIAVAVRPDLVRLEDRARTAESGGRVGDAFDRFVAYDRNAYASLGFVRDAAAATAVAQVPNLEPSRVALAMTDGLR